MGDFTDKYKALCAPFAVNAVSWRVGATNKRKRQAEAKKAGQSPDFVRATEGFALAYLDARDVAERLDSVLGSENWQCRYSHAGQKTVCDIGVRIGDDWIWKADGAGDSDIEAEKGALSDAFKRAAVRWGVGRYLYDIPSVWVKLDQREQIDHSELPRLMQLLDRNAPAGSMPTGVGQKSAYAAKKDGKWEAVVRDFRNAPTGEDLIQLSKDIHGEWIATIPEDWQQELRGIFSERMTELRAKQAA